MCGLERVFLNIVNINECLCSDVKKTYLLKGNKDLHNLSPGNGLGLLHASFQKQNMERHGFDQDCLNYSFIKKEGIIIEVLTSKVFTLTD